MREVVHVVVTVVLVAACVWSFDRFGWLPHGTFEEILCSPTEATLRNGTTGVYFPCTRNGRRVRPGEGTFVPDPPRCP